MNESTATPASTTETPDTRSPLERLSPSERETWDLKGELPAHITGKPAAAVASGDDAPAVDAQNQPIKGADGKPISKRDQRLNDRIRQGVEQGVALERTAREAAERRIKELEARQPAQPAGEPAKPAAKPAEDKEPALEDFLDQPDPYLAHARAVARWEVRQEFAARDKSTQERTAQERQHASLMERINAHGAREATLREATPDYDTKTQTVRELLDVRSPLTLAVLESPVSAQLILHLAEHDEDFQRIGALGLSDLPGALRAIERLEAKYDTGDPAASGAATPPPAKTVTSAPPPPTTLGTRSAAPADASKAAVSRKDFRAFDDEETAKDLARVARR